MTAREARPYLRAAGVVALVAAATLPLLPARSIVDAPTELADAPRLLADPLAVYDPVLAGEPLPDGYRVGLARDQIAPVYQPRFTDAGGVDWPGDSLVIGVAGPETAKAYPVTHLNSREMVVDSLDGIPLLVSW